ncbi:olfactory receptor 1J1 isoform X1 [Pteropus medius]|uniref:olfactory receptor 1J1-like isoform X1 n=2 Tax=Pteropus vampyrus TaxID=132908 RepID=UPI00196BB06F|nr:olfactory receptor 1J1-like isoform X1 [Pteropus giganteus]
MENQSSVSEFFLRGISASPEQQQLFFGIFLCMYLVTLTGNVVIILAISSDPHLHTPMYFFLANLSFVDMGLTSSTVTKTLVNVQTQRHTISYAGCFTQMYFFLMFGDLDSFFLAVMAYDRYVAICRPLHYSTVMSPQVCALLLTLCWVLTHAVALTYTLLAARLMRPDNQSSVSEFLLLGLPILPEQQGVFFALFLGMYLTTVLGNLLIILLIRLDSRLHTPMYFFLSHLAFTDVTFSSVTVPKMLINMKTQHLSIPFEGCISQTYFFIVFADLDSFLITSMAYDRYVAICHPLQYTTIMSQSVCVMLVAGSWVIACACALLHTLLLAQLSFCADNTIPHFFCDLAALLKLSCSDTSLNQLIIFTVGLIAIMLPFLCILVSYGHIGATILRVPSTKGIYKALSTCGSHLSVVTLYYGTIIVLYFLPSSNNTNDNDIVASLLYTVVTPMLNPFIYSLRNKDMKGALRKLLSKKTYSSN